MKGMSLRRLYELDVILFYMPPQPQHSDVGDASVATFTAFADDVAYTLTVGQALERFVAARRKPPSQRTLQRYCIEGRLAAQKIRTTYGSEWLINETSLARLIEAEPVVTGDAGVAVAPVLATPASPSMIEPNILAPDIPANGDASVAVAPHVMATPAGERRTIADVLIENSRLLAQVEGRDAVIVELKEDRNFLREEVREARRTRDDVKSISERMLDTLRTIAVGRLAMSAPPPQDPMRASIIDPDDQER